MALFGAKEKETREDKIARRTKELLDRYGLSDISPRDIESVKSICTALQGNGMIEFGTTLSGKAEDVAKLSYLRALVEQNWIIIRQLDRISKSLDQK